MWAAACSRWRLPGVPRSPRPNCGPLSHHVPSTSAIDAPLGRGSTVGLPTNLVDSLPVLIGQDDAVGVVAEHEAASVRVRDRCSAISLNVGVATEHQVPVGGTTSEPLMT